MKLPYFLPKELAFCQEGQDEVDLIKILENRSLEEQILFFESGIEDESWWGEKGAIVLKHFFEKFNRLFLKDQLNRKDAKRIAEAVKPHFSLFSLYIIEDLVFEIEKQKIFGNALLMGAECEFFYSLISQEIYERKKKSILLKNISYQNFLWIKEFCYTGTLTTLWKQAPLDVFSLAETAHQISLEPLIDLSLEIFKKYLDSQNVWHYLEKGSKGFPQLTTICCDFFNFLFPGLEFNALSSGLIDLKIARFVHEEALEALIPFVEALQLKQDAAQDPKATEYLKKTTNCRLLSLPHTSSITPNLASVLPSLVSLDLSYCPWLTDNFLDLAALHCPSLESLYLQGNRQLTPLSWGILGKFYRLGILDLRDCLLSDEELELISVACPRLTHLCLINCSSLTEKGILFLIKQCRELKSLAISLSLSDEAISVIKQSAPHLIFERPSPKKS